MYLEDWPLIETYLIHKSRVRIIWCLSSSEHLKAIEPEIIRRKLLAQALSSDKDVSGSGESFDDFPAL